MGRAMTRGLLRAGAQVVAVDLEQSALNSLGEDARRDGTDAALLFFTADVTRDKSADAIVDAAFGRFGHLDILVNNAGINLESLHGADGDLPQNFWDISPADYRLIIEVNSIAPFLLIRAAVPGMLNNGWGRIVNITTSLDSMFRMGMIPYGGSKAVTEAHSAAMADELAGTGVTVNVLIPGGMVRTRMTVTAAARFTSGVFEPEIMVDPLLWLTGPNADELTGRRLIAAYWDSAISPEQSLEKCSAPIAWPQVGKQAIFPTA